MPRNGYQCALGGQHTLCCHASSPFYCGHTGDYLFLAFLIAVPTVAAYGLVQTGLKRAESSLVAAYIYLQPVFAAIGAMIFLGEDLGVRTVICGAITLSACGSPQGHGHEGRVAAMKRRLGHYLSFTMKEDVDETDARGLVPLAEARRIVRATKPTKDQWGEFHAAVCSLQDAAEALRALKRAAWYVGPRWLGNVSLAERYGDAIFPWLETLVGKTGKPRSGSNVEEQLQQLATPEALELLFRIWAHSDDPDGTAQLFLELQRDGWRSQAELVRRGHARAIGLLATLAKKSPSGTKRALAKAVGKREAERLLAGTATALDEATILGVLDAAAMAKRGHRLPWPSFRSGASHFEYHTMRVIAARAREGDDWGILFEVVQGDAQGSGVRWPATIQHYRYGSRIADPGGHYLEDVRALRVPKVEVDASLAKKLDLRPGLAGNDPPRWPFVLRVRAALARDRDVFWNRPEQAIGSLDLGVRPAIVVATDSFAHVVGKQGGKPATLPSKSPMYRSLAKAIVTRDGSVFEPGAPNTDWRVHAKRCHPDPFAR